MTRGEIEAGARSAPRGRCGAALKRAARVIRARRADAGAARLARSPSRPASSSSSASRRSARVGCYVPGGRYPLPSSLLMTAIPARVAGVREVIVVLPAAGAAVMAAALEAGVSRLFRIGGAHAIAAMAYGTASVPRVDKIVGPGNA